MSVLLVNIVGPDGALIVAGTPVPEDWPADYVKSLTDSGGAGTQKAWETWLAANEAEAVARSLEPPLPAWAPPPPNADEALVEKWPEPPQVPAAVRQAAAEVIGAPTVAARKTAAETLARVVTKTFGGEAK